MSSDIAVRIARAEIRDRTWAMTRQCLGVHGIEMVDGQPAVAHVGKVAGQETYRVWFSVCAEPYFVRVDIAPDPVGALAVAWVGIAPRVQVYLDITSETVTPSEVSALIGIEPTATRFRGEPLWPRGRPLARVHWWCLEPQADVPGEVEEKLEAVLGSLEPFAVKIQQLRPKCDVLVVIKYVGWAGLVEFGDIVLDDWVVQRVAGMGAGLRIDMYARGPAMPADEASSHPRDRA